MSDKANIPQETAFVKPKKRWPIVIALILCVLLLVFAVVSVIVALADFQHGEIPTVFGWGICSSNGEYEPIDKNAAILLRKINDTAVVEEGDVVLFYYEGARANNKVYAGQVLENNIETLHVYVNEDLADVEIAKAALRGEVHFYVGHIGYVLNIIEDRYGVILSIALVVLLVSVIILLVGSYISIKEQRKIAVAVNSAKEYVEASSDIKTEEQESIYANENDADSIDGINEEIHSEQIAAVEPVAENEIAEAISEKPEEAAAIEIPAKEAPAEIAKESLEETVTSEMVTAPEEEAVVAKEALADSDMQSAAEEIQPEEESVVEAQEKEDVSAKEMPYATNMMFLFTVPEATLLKRLLEVAAEKREGSEIVAEVDEQKPALRVNCGTEEVAYVNAVVAAFKKRRSEKGQA